MILIRIEVSIKPFQSRIVFDQIRKAWKLLEQL